MLIKGVFMDMANVYMDPRQPRPAKAVWRPSQRTSFGSRAVSLTLAVAAFVEVLWPDMRHLYSNGKVDGEAVLSRAEEQIYVK